MLFVLAVCIPFILLVGGSFLLNYPATLGVLYSFNLTLIYLVLWAALNQAIKISSQEMWIKENKLLMMRKKIYMSFPLIRGSDIEIPLDAIRAISLVSSGVGYQLTVRFLHEDKVLGIDLDINPLKRANAAILRDIAKRPEVTVDEGTQKILDKYEEKISSWKRVYFISVTVIFLALAVFLGASLYIGAGWGRNTP